MLGPALGTLGLAIWFGGGLTVLAATRFIFRYADNRAQAGRFSGLVLHAFTGVRAFAAVMTLASTRWRAGIVLTVLMLAGAVLNRRIRRLRDELGGSTEGLDPADPRRKTWGALHGSSVMLLILQVLIAGVLLPS